MIEIGAKELSEKVIADAVTEGHKVVGQVCEMIDELTKKAGVEKEIPLVEDDEQLFAKIDSEIADKLRQAKQIPGKQERNTAVKELFEQITTKYCEPEDEAAERYDKAMVKRMLGKIESQVIHKLLVKGKRPDGRACDEIRKIACDVGVLPRTHGSALFTRGETQALVSITLGTLRDSQIVDGLVEEYSQNFMFHYNFPPFSVGDVRMIRGPGRREIGHGALAERSLKQVKPSKETF
ncbi:unnamed protein product, partial [marine sediment metagenome]